MKTCTKCHERKGIEHFGQDVSKKDGHASHCKVCRTSHERVSRVAGKRPYAYRKRNPKKVREYMVRCRYGLEPEDVTQLQEDQNHSCGICGKHLKRFHIDHDHSTGEVRGLLCAGCNSALGKFDDSIDILKSAINYLERKSKCT